MGVQYALIATLKMPYFVCRASQKAPETIKLPGACYPEWLFKRTHSETCLKFNNKKYFILSEEIYDVLSLTACPNCMAVLQDGFKTAIL